MHRATLDTMQTTLNEFFNQRERDGETAYVEDWGIIITGLRLANDGTEIAGRWQTAWPYYARFAHPDSPGVILGRFEEYDLYLCEQTGLPATLVARYGNEGHEYSTFNPKLLGIHNLRSAPPCFHVAYERACRLGYADWLTN
jgi:hypothetical protein